MDFVHFLNEVCTHILPGHDHTGTFFLEYGLPSYSRCLGSAKKHLIMEGSPGWILLRSIARYEQHEGVSRRREESPEWGLPRGHFGWVQRNRCLRWGRRVVAGAGRADGGSERSEWVGAAADWATDSARTLPLGSVRAERWARAIILYICMIIYYVSIKGIHLQGKYKG